MDVRFHEDAEEEFAKAVAYYNREREGLGFAFGREVRKAIARIQSQPKAHTILFQDFRRVRTKRFPYGVVYRIKENGILIVAVMHLRRAPDYWLKRLIPFNGLRR